MVDELKKAVKKAEELSRQGQNVIAQMILDEINWGETSKKLKNV
jgi:hypothetical protein